MPSSLFAANKYRLEKSIKKGEKATVKCVLLGKEKGRGDLGQPLIRTKIPDSSLVRSLARSLLCSFCYDARLSYYSDLFDSEDGLTLEKPSGSSLSAHQ